MLEAQFSEVLEDVGEEENISPKVEVVVVADGWAAEGVVDVFSVGIIVIGNAFNGEFSVESLLRREGALVESGPAVHILIGVDSLAEQEGTPLGAWLEICCDAHVLRIAGFHQFIQT